jgi:hypothetical protein
MFDFNEGEMAIVYKPKHPPYGWGSGMDQYIGSAVTVMRVRDLGTDDIRIKEDNMRYNWYGCLMPPKGKYQSINIFK